jgi:hypothetical protein
MAMTLIVCSTWAMGESADGTGTPCERIVRRAAEPKTAARRRGRPSVSNVAAVQPSPHRTEGFRFSTDPELNAEVREVVALYLHPHGNLVVVCVDQRSLFQAPDRSQPILPLRPGIPARDRVRHRMTCQVTALKVATGPITYTCSRRHQRHKPQFAWTKDVTRSPPALYARTVRNHGPYQYWVAHLSEA